MSCVMLILMLLIFNLYFISQNVSAMDLEKYNEIHSGVQEFEKIKLRIN